MFGSDKLCRWHRTHRKPEGEVIFLPVVIFGTAHTAASIVGNLERLLAPTLESSRLESEFLAKLRIWSIFSKEGFVLKLAYLPELSGLTLTKPVFTLPTSKVNEQNDLRHFSCNCWEHRSVTKKEIVKTISDETGLTQLQIKEIVQRTFQAIVENLVEEGRVELRNFGVFQVKPRAARKARNPRTGHQVDVPEKFVVTFKPGKVMEGRVKEMANSENAEAWKEMLRSQLSGDDSETEAEET